MEHAKILNRIRHNFRTFGTVGDEMGSDLNNNPMAHALKNEPLMFAAGVNVLPVVRVILQESGHDGLIKQRDDLLAACKYALMVAQEQHAALVHITAGIADVAGLSPTKIPTPEWAILEAAIAAAERTDHEDRE